MSTPETDPLVIRERLTELFKHPNLLPENLLAFLVDYLSVNMPEIPLGHIIGSPGALSSSSNQLSANVTITNANTYYDGPSLTLATGTWFLSGVLTCTNASLQSTFTAKIWDGTTVASSAQTRMGQSGVPTVLPICAIVSPTVSTAYKISVASDDASGTILAAAPFAGAGNNASTLVAVKIA